MWKKQDFGIEFVKHYRTSLKAIVGVSASEDGKMFATISANGEGRVFDVVNFGECVRPTELIADMINIFKFGFTPKACCWVHEAGAGQTLLAVSDIASPTIRIYDGRGDGKPLYELTKLHRAPVHLMVVSEPPIMTDQSIRPNSIRSCRPTKPAFSSTGSQVSLGVCLLFLACGSTRAQQICSTSKR